MSQVVDQLIDAYLDGASFDDLYEMIINGDIELDEDDIDEQTGIRRTFRRPRLRRFRARGPAVSPVTGKRKDPRRRMLARKLARRFAGKRRQAARRFARSAKGKAFHKKLGALAARIRR
jgi:hypothetical protein